MCIICEDYEYSKRCGSACTDHSWTYEPPDTDGDELRWCRRCNDHQYLDYECQDRDA